MKKIINHVKLILFKIKHGYFYKKYLKKFSTYEKVEKYCSKINSNNYSDEKLNNFRLKRFINNIDTIPEIKKPSYNHLEESIKNYNTEILEIKNTNEEIKNKLDQYIIENNGKSKVIDQRNLEIKKIQGYLSKEDYNKIYEE